MLSPFAIDEELMLMPGRRVLVAGASGRSGAAAARLLYALGAVVLLSDRSAESQYLDLDAQNSAGRVLDLRPREDPGILDDHPVDLVVTAPGVPLSGPLFEHARALGIPIIGENDLGFYQLRKSSPCFVIGITGTDGKSTTTAMVTHLLKQVGTDALSCGNFGTPLSEVALQPPGPTTVLVVECSSFQLEPLAFFHPNAAAILNVAADHQDRYADAEAYLKAKFRIALLLESGDSFFVAPSLLPAVRRLLPTQSERAIAVDRAGGDSDSAPGEAHGVYRSVAGALTLPGAHNQSNLAFAVALVLSVLKMRGILLDVDLLRAAVASFRGLPHRMEVVAKSGRLTFVNDSKATTIQAVERALESYGSGGGVHHLLGGRSKGADFQSLRGLAPDATVYPFGEAAALVGDALGVTERYANLEAALIAAANRASASSGPQIILLSPGCASYDQFRSFEERGQRFREVALQWLEQHPGDIGEHADQERD